MVQGEAAPQVRTHSLKNYSKAKVRKKIRGRINPQRFMIYLPVGQGRFVLRVAGVVFDGDRVLTERLRKWDWCCLPGGRVNFLEFTEDALRREMQEELRCNITIDQLLWIAENFFQGEEEGSEPHHEIGFYYLMRFPDDSSYYGKTEPFLRDQDGQDMILQWRSLAELETCRLYPAFLRKGLQALPEKTEHVHHLREGKLAL